MAASFAERLRQPLTGVLTWDALTALWQRVAALDGWYLYTVGEDPPAAPASPDGVAAFLRTLDARLRAEHDRDECGIVYADDLAAPSLIKVYDPKRLGAVCGPSRGPVPPGWILSRVPPERIDLPQPPRTRFRFFRGLGRSAADS
ncbi:MAG TPA: hypothetical protein VLW45_04755 [Pelomicrobium sp.]|nr:hypothetical protein [Pelomicrobium sp.]